MVEIAQQFIDEMIAHAQEDNPNECCGILAGQTDRPVKTYRMMNVEASPYRYSMDSKELYHVYREIEDNQLEMYAIYHSHTHTEAYPSATDIRLATWPEAYYILISLQNKQEPTVRAFTILDGQVSEVPIN